MRPIDADAALKALRKCQTYLYDARDPELKIELSSAEAAINNLSTIQPVATDTNVGDNSVIPNSSDAVSRQAAIDALNKQIQQCRKALGSLGLSDVDKHAVEVKMASLRAYRKMLENLPTIQPEPQKGHWINGKCDLCGEHAPFWCMASTYHESNFCPNCGADMRGEKDERTD